MQEKKSINCSLWFLLTITGFIFSNSCDKTPNARDGDPNSLPGFAWIRVLVFFPYQT